MYILGSVAPSRISIEYRVAKLCNMARPPGSPRGKATNEAINAKPPKTSRYDF